MVKRCKDCPGKEADELKINDTSDVQEVEEKKIEIKDEHEGEKRFSFPKYGVHVYAKNIQEANEKLQSILTSEEK